MVDVLVSDLEEEMVELTEREMMLILLVKAGASQDLIPRLLELFMGQRRALRADCLFNSDAFKLKLDSGTQILRAQDAGSSPHPCFVPMTPTPSPTKKR